MILDRVFRGGLITKVTFKQRPECMEGVSHGAVWEEELSRQRE